MTPQQWIGLSVRLFTVWFFLSGLSTVLYLVGQSDPEYRFVIYPIIAVYLIAVGLLWFFPMTIAHKLLPRTRFNDVLSTPLKDTVVVACIILGLWIFAAKVVPGLAGYALAFLFLLDKGANTNEYHINNLVPLVVNCVAAAVLCFKAHPIARFMTTEPTLPKEEEVE